MKLELTEDNYIDVYAEIDYFLHYRYGVLDVTDKSSLLEFDTKDIILTASQILDDIYETTIEITADNIKLENPKKSYRFLGSFDKVGLRRWINKQVKDKEKLDDYIRFNYKTNFNKLTKMDLLDIVLDYL